MLPFHEALFAAAQKLHGKHYGSATTIQFEIEGEGVYRPILEEAGPCRVGPAGGGAVTVRIQAEDAVKLMSGQLNLMVAFTTGKIHAQGDVPVHGVGARQVDQLDRPSARSSR